VQQLIIEAEAQMMSEQSLRNDPQGRGFHGGDPELRATLTSDPRERRGREFKGPDDIYGSKPDVYRSIIIPEEGDTSPIFYPKYLGEGVGFFPADQYKPGSPKETNMNILGYYDKDLDEIGLLRTTDVVGEYGGLFDNIADETEAHEYIHRYAGKGGDAAADHQYIEQAFSDLEPVTADNAAKKTEELLENFLITQEQREIMKNMDSFEKSFYINEQRQRIFQELIARNNLQNQITTFAKGGPTVIDGLPVVNPVADVGSITPISPFEMTETFGGPLYQMLNPSAKRMVDRLGLGGQGLSGAAAMAFGPQKKASGVSAGLQKLFEMFPKLKGNPLEVIKQTPKIIKKLQNKVTDQKINVSSGATRDKLLKTRSENQELIKELKKYENEADNYFKNILNQPGSMTFDPKFANTVKEYIKIKDPKLINIGLTKNFDNQNILIALKKSEILDDIKKLNKIEVLQKPNSTFADKLLASELKKETKFKTISEALEELNKLN